MKRTLSTFLAFLFCLSPFAATITIGSGGGTNTSTTYPAPYGNWYWGSKHQILITASELNAAGMSAGDINSLAFNVQTANGTALEDFEIGIKHTSASTVSGFDTGFTPVFGPSNYMPTTGWNTHTFSSPFYWDGVQNLLIDVCFNNSAFTGNDVMFHTSTSFTSVVYTFQDASGICSSPGFSQTSNLRPDIQFDWTVPSIPPVAEFSASTLVTCSGDVCFTDLSTNNPTSWLWDFGDSNTSTSENPCHTYTSDGTYTVTLTATNAFGSDTEIKTAYVTVNLSGGTPVAASCTPATLNGSLGFGISNVSLNTLNNSSGDASEGYGDFTCQQTTVFAGQSYTLDVSFVGPSTLNGAAWIDYNNDGVLNDATERILDASGSMSMTGTITIPSSAVLNTPLRLRVSADYDFSAPPTPCSDSDYGQAEDYKIIVQQDTSPPVTTFTSDVVLTCDGVVNFEDLSTNLPTAWAWNFGDGGTSVAENPTHTYTANGVYTVSLSSANAFGTGSDTIVGYITVDLDAALTAASCTPATLGYCCDYGIYRVELNSINNSTPDGSENYQDYSCQHNTSLDEGTTYTLDIRTGPSAHDTKVWLDYNNDGAFDDATELILDAPNQTNPSTNYTVPVGVAPLNTPIRMRVMSDVVGGITDACSDQTFGQTEDYGITIKDPNGIDEIGLPNVTMYPNPTSHYLQIIVDGDERITNWSLIDLTGRVIESGSAGNNSLHLNVSDLTAGQYFLMLNIGEKTVAKQFVKQ